MSEVFADSSYWIGLLYRRDQLHGRVGAIKPKLQSVRVVTSEMVLTEIFNASSHDRYLRKGAVVFVEGLRQYGDVLVLPQTSEQFEAAFQKYKKNHDKEWSLTDCASFVIMEERGIRAALTQDHHFVQAGFEALLR